MFYRAKIKRHSGEKWENTPAVPVHPHDANLISSETAFGDHYLFIDLDWDHWYTESSTPGHGHLVIRKNLDLDALKEVVDMLVKHGILQEGIKKQLDDRGCLTLRMPGMKKDNPQDNMSFEELAANGIAARPVEEKESRYAQGGLIMSMDPFLDFDITAKRKPI